MHHCATRVGHFHRGSIKSDRRTHFFVGERRPVESQFETERDLTGAVDQANRLILVGLLDVDDGLAGDVGEFH
jgi:hypothetical protein